MRRLLASQAVKIVYDEGRRVRGAMVAAFAKKYPTKDLDHKWLRRRLESSAMKLYNLSVGSLEPGVAHMLGFGSMERQQQHYRTNLLAMSVDDEEECARSAVAHLMECGTDIATPGMHGMTPLHVACRNGALRVVCLLLDHGADAAVLNEDGVNCLLVAAHNGHGDIVEVLAQRGMAIDAVNNDGMSPLHVAAENGDAAVVGLLLRLQPTAAQLRTHSGWTPLHCAALHGNSDAVRLLIEHGSEINAVANDGLTPLDVAIAHGSQRYEELEDLNLEKKKPWMRPVPEDVEEGPMPADVAAAKRHRSATVADLLRHGASINRPNARGETPMHAAATTGDTWSIKALAQNGANVNAADALGESPLHAAVKNDRCYAVGALAKLGADVNAQSHKGMTPLHVAVHTGRERFVGQLVELGANIDVPDALGDTPLLAAVVRRAKHSGIIKALVKHGANVGAVNALGETSLHVACKNDVMHHYCRELLANRLVHVNARSNNGRTPLHVAVANGLCYVANTLVHCGADINAVTAEGETPLFVAAKYGHKRCVILCLSTDKRNLDVPAKGGVTPLLIAAEMGHLEIVQLLVERGANINATTDDGRTPLSAVAKFMQSRAERQHQTAGN